MFFNQGRFRNEHVWDTILDLLFGGSEPLIPGSYGPDLFRGTIPMEVVGLVLISVSDCKLRYLYFHL